MAHKAENEETEFKTVPEPLTLCINCGVAGISAANICQVCFKSTATTSSLSSAVKLSEKTRRSVSIKSPAEVRSDLKALTAEDEDEDDAMAPVAKKEVNRCSGCRRKVGLAGFRCRCGELFCSVHRYSDRHDCSYDYKAAGRETIARENPVVKGAKMVRI